MRTVAVIFYGLMRNLKKTYLSIRTNIFQDLVAHDIRYRVYLHTYQLDVLDNYRSGEHNVRLDNDEWKMLQPYRYMIEDQNVVDSTLPLDEFCQFPNPWPEDPTKNSMKNLLRQLHSLKMAWHMMEDDPEYDAYLILRPDLLYIHPIITAGRITVPVRGLDFYLPEWGRTRNGDNDRVCVTSKIGAYIYMNRMDHIFQYAHIDAPNSHRFLKAVLDACHAIRYPLSIKALRVRADGDHMLKDVSIKTFFLQALYRSRIARYQ